MSKFNVDLERLNVSHDALNAELDKLNLLKTDLDKAVQTLKDGWVSDGATAFMSKFDSNYLELLTKYADLMGIMVEALGYAKTEFAILEESGANLKL